MRVDPAALLAYKTRKRISYSEAVLWGNCPWAHKLKYIDKLNIRSESIFTVFGGAIHHALEYHLNDSVEDKIKAFNEEYDKNLAETRKDVEISDKDVEIFRAQGLMLLEHILSAMKEKFGEFEIIGSEALLEYPIEDFKKDVINFKGYIDLVIMTPDEHIHIIDFKTSTWGWDSRKKAHAITNYQLALYKHFFAKIHEVAPEKISCHFILLKRTAKKDPIEVVTITSGKVKIQNAVEWLVNAVTNIYNHVFIKNRANCNRCEYQGTDLCPLSSGLVTKTYKIYADKRETEVKAEEPKSGKEEA